MKTVTISNLKAHLSENLRAAQRGEEITVLDRETPIARIVPLVPLVPLVPPRYELRVARPATRPMGTFKPPNEPSGVTPEQLQEALDAERRDRF